jgi:peptidoglycan/LPS O-acetylase OafA/YrhL
MGVSILWIMFFHSGIDLPNVLMPIEIFKTIGYSGVDIFFLLSGIGLTFSIKNSKSLKHFFLKRLERILPAYLIYMSIRSLYELLITTFSLSHFILSLIGFVKDVWFIPAILVCYLFFPFYYKISLKFTSIKIFIYSCVIILSICCLIIIDSPIQYFLIFTIRVPIFLYGCHIGIMFTSKQDLVPRYTLY